MPLSLRNLDYIRSKDPRLAETFKDLAEQFATLESQVNGSATGEPKAPPAINSLVVTAQNGHFSAAISDNNQSLYRGVGYFLEHADNPNFTDPQIIHLGTTRNWNGFLGNVTRFWRAYSAYPGSPSSAPAYHGGNAIPQPVSGGGTVPGAVFQPSQGSGTGAQGVGLSGFGPVPYRGVKPPIR